MQKLRVIGWRERDGTKDEFVNAFPRAEMVKEMGYRLLVL